MATALVQVPVIKGEGSKQFFINKTITLPTGFPAYKIHSVDFEVIIENKDLQIVAGTPGKIIVNGKLKKNVVYKFNDQPNSTDGDNVVFGYLRHATVEYEIAGFVDLNTPGNEVLLTDIPEKVNAFVEGYKEELEGPTTDAYGNTVYAKIHEKIVVKVDLKAVRYQHLEVTLA